ncbi:MULTISPECIES: DHA2 family efflux MFS transporter permease subunit [Micromonospora]|uniref:EmrB/QacA drug resistance transporter n=4 Tax=Micromonospora TaxID=1873 RepID=F4F7F0_MICM1|nr:MULTISPECIES: DHA2 family efflux MFS transporter permease subunit [Micromonospora]AIS85740.1 EmrB/QacA family drug resistance transporter [Verrucosispora sp. MS100047]AEB44389.1 EmrB/QacA family drug resistance transporter [Micromonospora maris AB-18-032]AEK75506.1 EmrB/QacA drug resistance transporter [Micromonospora maris AB-18-032]KUJ43918.1 EmrB/QacA family drug resistance transporter [Micromonospora maris]RUL90372.1 DHA2 family efflux MFS transporter permease subunit [Verrucosispora sp
MTQSPSDRIDGPLLRLLGVMVLGGVMSYFDATIINVSVETLTAHFDATLGTISWVATGYLLAVAVAIPLAGWAVARFGARRVWLAALTLFLVASALCALAWDVGSLIAFRVFQGFAGGLLEPIMLTVVATAAGPSRMGRAMGLISIPITLGPVLGPIIGGLILQNLTWQWIFLVNVPIALLAIALALLIMRDDRPEPGAAPPLDLIGVALLSPGFAALIYALSQAGTAGFGATRVIVGLAVGVVLVAAYVAHALRSAQPLIDLRLFRSSGFTSSVLTMFLLGGMLFSLLFLLPLFYQQVRGQGVLAAGLLLVPLGLGTMVGMPVAGKLADTFGPRRLVPTGALLIALSALVYTQAGPDTSQVLLTAAQLVTGFGLGLVGAPTMGSVYRTVAPEAVGGATGTLFILNQIGASLGVAVVALIVQSGLTDGRTPADSFDQAFWWTVAGGVIVALASRFLPGRPQPVTPTPADAETAAA